MRGLKFQVYKKKGAYTSKVSFWLQIAVETVSGNYVQTSGPTRNGHPQRLSRIALPLFGYIIDCNQSQTDYKMAELPKMAGRPKKSNYYKMIVQK